MASAGNRFLSILALAALLCVPGVAAAQNGRIRGAVHDAHGGPLAGAAIVATNQSTGATRRTTATSDGSYTVSVPAGTYTVSASVPGLRTVSQKGVQVSADGEASVDLTMQALELEAITVTAMLREQELTSVPLSIAAPLGTARRWDSTSPSATSPRCASSATAIARAAGWTRCSRICS